MRCKSFRIYLVLVFGIAFGIFLSSFLQIFALFPAVVMDERPVHSSRALDNEVQTFAGFENLNHKTSTTQDPIELPKDHFDETVDYPVVEKLDLEDIEEAISSQIIKEEMTKKNVYMENNWQGRNMQDLHDDSSEGSIPIDKLSDELSTRKSLLIAVITSVQQLMSQTMAIHGTWAKEELQHVLYFVGDVQHMPHLPHGMVVIQLEGIADKQAPWEVKEMAVFKYLIAHYLEQVDWYLVVGDDTYVKPSAVRQKLEEFNPNVNAYIGNRRAEKEFSMQCSPSTGIVYSRGLVSRLEQYLPQCIGEGLNIGSCIIQRGVHCTRAQETRNLFFNDHNRIIETTLLYTSKKIVNRALTLYPIRYPKFMYRLYSYLKEIQYNDSNTNAMNAINEIELTHPFIPTHLRSSFKPTVTSKDCSSKPSDKTTTAQPLSANNQNHINIRPRFMPKNKFEVNPWDYFNQTRIMSVNNEQPSSGIIGGIREEARFILTKGIFAANQGLSSTEKLIFHRLENGYHRIDPMRGSEYILDFVFRKSVDKYTLVKKRVNVLRPFHETVVPIDYTQHLPRVNFVITLSGLSNRLEKFLEAFEKNVLIPKEDASLTIALYDSPDAEKVHSLISKYLSFYPDALLKIIDVEGTFARGVGLHRGTVNFQDDDLLFFVDIDLEIGADFLRRARLNAIQGKQVYFPIFFKLYKIDFVNKYHKGNSSQLLKRHNGHWAHYSFGMVVVYASDYRKVGGYDVSLKGWGEEDVDFFNRVIQHGLEAFRAPDPGLIHLWHPKICNPDAILTQEAYYHCLQSKAENLADRIELANYIFHNNLISGNAV